MKCNDCLNLLTEYIDGEVIETEAERISAHLITCAGCTKEFELLTAEQELFARYDRELEIAPAMWSAIQARTAVEDKSVSSRSKFNLRLLLAGLFATPRSGLAFSGALAVLIAAVVIGVMYLRMQPQLPGTGTEVARTVNPGSVPPPPIYVTRPDAPVNGGNNPGSVIAKYIPPMTKTVKHDGVARKTDDPGVFTPLAYSDLEERDTAEHVRQAENLLRSIRTLQDGQSADDREIDVSYEKAMSRRLLNENAVLLQDAEVAGKFPTKELLKDLEPFLVDIANLPDKTTANQLRVIKDRVQKTEIVAALMGY
jgi:hypothetical protein